MELGSTFKVLARSMVLYEQMQIQSTGCSLKFEVFWILVFLIIEIFDTYSLRDFKKLLKNGKEFLGLLEFHKD